jgi:type IV secretion system protein VirB5
MTRTRGFLTLTVVILLLAPRAHAQFAVIDVGAITQLVTEVQTLQAALDTARNQLTAAQAEYTALTGPRGMDRLLSGTARNYLPASWADVQNVAQAGGSRYVPLATAVAATVTGNAVLAAPQLAVLPVPVQRQIGQEREWLAMAQQLSREELAVTSARFASLQQLIAALSQAADPKAVMDLQARIAIETAMLQNEQTKLQTLQRLTLSEQDVVQQQRRELATAGHGTFAARFQPAP